MTSISPSFVALIAYVLNSAQVPCVLWGHCLLNVHGVPSIVGVSPLDHANFMSRLNYV